MLGGKHLFADAWLDVCIGCIDGYARRFHTDHPCKTMYFRR